MRPASPFALVVLVLPALACGGGRAAPGPDAATGTDSAGGPFVPPASARADTIIDDGWRFFAGDAAGAEAVDFDDAAWGAVTLPHTWNALDGEDGGNDYRRGAGWYRRHLPGSAPALAAAAGARVYLQLDGASMVADVWVNGVHLGQHRGGFATCRFDATGSIRLDGDNVIAVKTDNSAVPDVPPLSADFTFFGGLYRDVHLVVVDPLHVDLDDLGSPGVYLTPANVTADAADLSARVRVTNAGAAPETADVALDVVAADGALVARLTAAARVDAGATAEVVLTGTIATPHLWNGRGDPYLYTAYAVVARARAFDAGAVTDVVAQPLGFRSFAVDAASGFSLNGRTLDLHGVNRHQDRLDMGWAITDREHDEDMALIVELGATAIRLAHYQHARHFYDLCDQRGLVVWAELPLVNSVTDSAAFTDDAEQQLRELVRQNYNHPSVFFWSLANEQADTAAANTLLDALQALAHAEDPTRLTTLASDLGDADPIGLHTDVVGFNKYYGWYTGTVAAFAPWLDGFHANYPARAVAVSEYGAGAGISLHAAAPVIMDHTEEYQSAFHETYWQALAARPFVWGKFVWNMFDFASDGRNEGETPGRNDKGLVTYDRRTKKDAFYFYKASWSSEPFVYITSRRFNPRTTATIDVKVYSNVDTVALTVNGAALPPVTAPNHVFTWAGVALDVGDNRVEADATNGAGANATDAVVWTRM
jgi:beta-galactosidase